MTIKDPTEPSHRGWLMNVDLARIQFAFTSVNHFFFVPVTIGLAFLTARVCR
jgi:cytochrome bd-type quinol oxidase subunit 1